MSRRSPLGFTEFKKPYVFHHPMQAKNLYSILKWADSNQISMDLTLENNEDSISFL